MKCIWLMGLLILAVGCASPAKKGAADKPGFRAMGQTVPTDEARSDESIGFDVRHQINLAGPVNLAAVVVMVNDAVVTLRGSVATQTDAFRAESAAKAVKGVKLVIDELQITQAGPYH